MLGGVAAAQGPAREHEVKAAFLLHFARYVEWPPEIRPSPDDAIEICILGQDPFSTALDALVAVEAAERDLAVVVRRVTTTAQARHCQIVFVNRPTRTAQRRDLAELRDSPVLTVGDGAGFLEDGGIVAFRVEEDRVRLSISVDNSRHARLRISSRLLDIARVVDTS